MGAFFPGTGSLQTTAPLIPPTAQPMTMACWARATNTAVTQTIMCFASNSTDYIEVQQATNWAIGDGTGVNFAGAATAGMWTFLLARWITTTSMRLTTLTADGTLNSGQRTNSSVHSALITIGLGERVVLSPVQAFTGAIAEFWYTATDIVGSDVAPGISYIHQLAFFGPFSIPSVGQQVEEYRSLRLGGTARYGDSHSNTAGSSWVADVALPPTQHPPIISNRYPLPRSDVKATMMM